MESAKLKPLSKKRNAKIRGQGHPKDTIYSLLFADKELSRINMYYLNPRII